MADTASMPGVLTIDSAEVAEAAVRTPRCDRIARGGRGPTTYMFPREMRPKRYLSETSLNRLITIAQPQRQVWREVGAQSGKWVSHSLQIQHLRKLLAAVGFSPSLPSRCL
jgi:hypothetical protein